MSKKVQQTFLLVAGTKAAQTDLLFRFVIITRKCVELLKVKVKKVAWV